MSDVLLDSREVERLLDLKPSTLRWMADGLGAAHGRKGVARKWSMGDLTLIVIAQRLADRGFTIQAAATLARSFGEAQFARLVENNSAQLFLVAFPLGGGEFDAHVCETTAAVFDVIDRGRDPLILDLRLMFHEALALVVAARRGDSNA